jgi:hypothetical protein
LSLDSALYLDPSGVETQQSLDAQSSDTSSDTAANSAASAAPPPSSSAMLLLAYMPSLRQITAITQTGTTTASQVQELTHLCIAGCEQLNGLMRECLVEAAKKKVQQ